METLPGVTNTVPFKTPYPSRRSKPPAEPRRRFPFRRLSGGLFAPRRRYRGPPAPPPHRPRPRPLPPPAGCLPRHPRRAYPDYLSAPLAFATTDFMDGNPAPLPCHRWTPPLLRRVDGVDNGGTMKTIATTPSGRPLRRRRYPRLFRCARHRPRLAPPRHRRATEGDERSMIDDNRETGQR